MENMEMRKTVLLTGNSGYIGTVMTGVLKRASYRVIGLDSNWFDPNRLFAISKESKPDKEIVKDIRNITARDLDGIDAVIHLAGLSNDPMGDINPRLTEEINFKATVRLGKLCKERGIGRFIFASSCSIYGIAATDTPIDEKGLVNPLTAYAKAKVDAERGLEELADNNFHPVYMRNATVYGLSPRLRLDLVVNNLLAWAYLKNEISIMSDGTPWRPIVHIEDFCNAFLAALKAPVEKIHNEAFNVGINTENYQVKDIALEVKKVVPGAAVKILNKTGGDDRSYRVDFSKIAGTLTDFRPKWTLAKGVEELHEAYKKHNLTAEDFDSDRYFRLRTIKTLMASGKVDNDLCSVR